MIPSIEQLAKWLFEIENHSFSWDTAHQELYTSRASKLIEKAITRNPKTTYGIYKVYKTEQEECKIELIAYFTEWEEFTSLILELEKSLKIHEASPYLSRSSSEFYNQRQIIKASKKMVDDYYQELYSLGQVMIEHLRAISLILQTQYTESVTHNMKKAVLDKVVFPLIEGGIKKIRDIQKNGVKKYSWLQGPEDLWQVPYPVTYLIEQIKELKLQLNRQSSEIAKDEDLDDIPM